MLAGAGQQQQPAIKGSGLAELAANRAELYQLQRRILDSLAKDKGWIVGWAAIAESKPVADVVLVDTSDHSQNVPSLPMSDGRPIGILSETVQSALETQVDYQTAFELLTDAAVRLFILGNRPKSTETLLGDQALLKFHIGDYASAAQYFQRIVPKYLENAWSYVQAEMLRVYARCLKELHRRDEFMRVTLGLLSKVAARNRDKQSLTIHSDRQPQPLTWLDEDAVDVHGSLAELVTLSTELTYNFTAQLGDFFSDLVVSPEIIQYPNKDGFVMTIECRFLIDDVLTFEKARMRLIDPNSPSQEIWVESLETIELKQGRIRIGLWSNVCHDVNVR